MFVGLSVSAGSGQQPRGKAAGSRLAGCVPQSDRVIEWPVLLLAGRLCGNQACCGFQTSVQSGLPARRTLEMFALKCVENKI